MPREIDFPVGLVFHALTDVVLPDADAHFAADPKIRRDNPALSGRHLQRIVVRGLPGRMRPKDTWCGAPTLRARSLELPQW